MVLLLYYLKFARFCDSVVFEIMIMEPAVVLLLDLKFEI